jgi:hypothetical protein
MKRGRCPNETSAAGQTRAAADTGDTDRTVERLNDMKGALSRATAAPLFKAAITNCVPLRRANDI